MNRDLFGEEIKSDYEKFTEKFEVKLTTDDCYTPPAVFDFVLHYVKEQCGISDTTRVIRPFRPNGDYEAEDYGGDCVVIDNPPFSILTKICRFYEDRGIKYFLFAPHLTLFSSSVDATRIVASADIKYHNGAVVKTSFISNMFGDIGVIADPTYRREIARILNEDKPRPPKYKYPENVVTVSRLAKIVERGGSFSLDKKDIYKVPKLDDQAVCKKAIFGSGYLISDARAEELRAEELRAEELWAEDDVRTWRLSQSERIIIERLGGGGGNKINLFFNQQQNNNQ